MSDLDEGADLQSEDVVEYVSVPRWFWAALAAAFAELD